MSELASCYAAFMVGLLGGVHCIGMCGGLASALVVGASGPRVPMLLTYNAGRVTSYVTAGACAGWLGASGLDLVAAQHAQNVLQILAGAFMIALGAYLAQWWGGLSRIERLGARLWRTLEPLGRRLLPVRTLPAAYGYGMIWGWLPCGLVYSVLIWALSSGGARQGALLMLSFGCGTLPTLVATGAIAGELRRLLTTVSVRRAVGALVAMLGVALILGAAGVIGWRNVV